MSISTSPRPPSLESTPTSSRTGSPAPGPNRRNRAALRDYYGIKNATSVDDSRANPQQEEAFIVKASPLDAEDYDAEAYVRSVLAKEGLEGVLRVEGSLVSEKVEMKCLDGERKALVYDNYSKLITATDTIRKMRTNMDPLTPTTSTLSPAISHIAETTASLAKSLQGHSAQNPSSNIKVHQEERDAKRKQSETVRWVLGTPSRLSALVATGQGDAAEKDWNEIRFVLEKWRGINGVKEVDDECMRIMGRQ